MPDAKPPQGKEPATLQSTRQMLDELDALMDRMLAIPVNDLDDTTSSPRGIVRMPTVSATLTVLEAPVEDEEIPARREGEALGRDLLRESFPSYSTNPATKPQEIKPLPLLIAPPPFQPAPKPRNQGSEGRGEGRGARGEKEDDSFSPLTPHPSPLTPDSSLPDPDPIPEEVIPPSITAITALPVPIIKPDEPETPVRFPGRSLASRCLLLLLWFNQGFDKGTFVLGRTGRWLRGPQGRHFLGWTGLALLAAAGLWLVKDWLGWTW